MDSQATVPVVSIMTIVGGALGVIAKTWLDAKKVDNSQHKNDNDFRKHESSSLVNIVEKFMLEFRADREERKGEIDRHISNAKDIIEQLRNEGNRREHWADCAGSFLRELSEVKEKLSRQEEALKQCEERSTLHDVIKSNHDLIINELQNGFASLTKGKNQS